MAETRVYDLTLSTDTSAYANADLLADTQSITDVFRQNDGGGIVRIGIEID